MLYYTNLLALSTGNLYYPAHLKIILNTAFFIRQSVIFRIIQRLPYLSSEFTKLVKFMAKIKHKIWIIREAPLTDTFQIFKNLKTNVFNRNNCL